MQLILIFPFLFAMVLIALSPFLGSVQGEIMLTLARVIPVEMMAASTLLRSPPFSLQMRWSDYVQYYMSVTTAATSLMLSSAGHTFLMVDLTYVFGLVFLTMSRLVSILGLCFWIRRRDLPQGGVIPNLSTLAFLAEIVGDCVRPLCSSLLGELCRKPQRIAMVMLGVALLWWRARLGWMTGVYCVLVVLQAALQWRCYGVWGSNPGTVWGVRSGVLLVLSHFPVIVTGCRPISESWTMGVYFIAMAAYALSAVYTPSPLMNPGPSLIRRLRG